MDASILHYQSIIEKNTPLALSAGIFNDKLCNDALKITLIRAILAVHICDCVRKGDDSYQEILRFKDAMNILDINFLSTSENITYFRNNINFKQLLLNKLNSLDTVKYFSKDDIANMNRSDITTEEFMKLCGFCNKSEEILPYCCMVIIYDCQNMCDNMLYDYDYYCIVLFNIE